MSDIQSSLRLPAVDALRGLAALYVLTAHVVFIPSPSLELPEWATKVIHNGVTGTTLFFVVSAFTICMSARLRASEQSGTMSFYIRRLLRIAPLFYCWILASLIIHYYFFGAVYKRGEFALNLTFIFNCVPGKEAGIV
jgi:peptidoglycan/LPS O-acetylase OafA/YrhL